MITQQRLKNLVIPHVTWKQFETFLTTIVPENTLYITYDQGQLELMTPLPEHEYYKTVLSTFIEDIADNFNLDYECLGSTTWKREKYLAGIEPDNCFYFTHEPLIRGKLTLDLDTDPPPDLALEIDLTSKSINRFPVYARIGIPEIWCYDNQELKVYLLQDRDYQESSNSQLFPNLPLGEIPPLIEKFRLQGRKILRQQLKNWIQQFI